MTYRNFNEIQGHQEIKHSLTRMVETQRIPHSLLFAGAEGVGKRDFAYAFAQMVISQNDPHGKQAEKAISGAHPDIHFYKPEGKIAMHSMEALRQFQDEVYLAPHEASWKVFIIDQAERMLPYSANALLKTFEEPASKTLIILLSSRPENLLSTILSRCQRIYFKPNIEQQRATVIDHPLLLQILEKGRMASYLDIHQVSEDIEKQYEQAKEGLESDAKEGLKSKDLSPIQQEILEKQLEGFIMLEQIKLLESSLSFILYWFRDMHLLHCNGKKEHLFLPSYTEVIQQCLQRGEILVLDTVEELIAKAKLSFERFSPTSSIFETLFLSLYA